MPTATSKKLTKNLQSIRTPDITPLMTINSSYLYPVLSVKTHSQVIANTVDAIEKSKYEFDTIVFTGMSGALVAGTIAIMLNKNLTIIRKESDSTHSNRIVEGYIVQEMSYIVIDDFSSTGRTLGYIFDKMKEDIFGKTAKCNAIFLWGTGAYNSKSFYTEKNNQIPIIGTRRKEVE